MTLYQTCSICSHSPIFAFTFHAVCMMHMLEHSSHPHGKGYNLAAASSAVIAILFDAATLAFWYSLPTISYIFIMLGICCGIIAAIVSFTASCRAYRRCGLKAIASLYGLVLLCHIFSLAEVATCMSIIVTSERDCYGDDWDASCEETGHCYWFIYSPTSFQIVTTVLVSISSLLWLISFVFVLMVPPFKDADIEDNATTTPRGSADNLSHTNEEGGQDDLEEMFVHIKTVSAVPVPISEDGDSPTLQYTTCSGGGHCEKHSGPLEP